MAGLHGGVMELPGSSRDRAALSGRFERLTGVFRALQTAVCPGRSAAEEAAVILSGVRGLPGEDCDSSVELISLTLVEKIASSLTSHSLPPDVETHFTEMLRVLLEDLELMSSLVHHFQAEDQIIAHLAAKSVSTCVFYQLHKCDAVSPVWEQKCVQAFHSSPPGPELDACLWSLTEIFKRLLKGAHREIFRKLLSVFDSSLSALCSKFLPEAEEEGVTSSRRWGTTFCLLLDLLEVLTVSSLTCGGAVCLRSQRLTCLSSSALLATIGCSSQYFVQKRVLLLLKRAVLQKAGEDWTAGDEALKYEDLDCDMSALAHSVLSAVDANWLDSVQVDSASFFGGTRSVRGAEAQTADCVTLRAVSLLLLKSLELHIQTAAGAAGVDRGTRVHGYLQSLWRFLRRHSIQLTEVHHCCSWVSLLFGEQDDDMMEAAKALLSIFLHQRRCSGLVDSAVLEAACASGCNPHCHFLILLQSISFDHSILLDFLISTETCFLEYFVRYLKYLQADRQGFNAACERIGLSGRHVSLQNSLTSSCGRDLFACEGEPDRVEFSSRVQPTGVVSAVERSSSTGGLRLVDYGSSDESDPESMDFQDEPVTSACEKSRSSALALKEEISGQQVPLGQKHFESSHSAGLLGNSVLERGAEGATPPEQTSRPNMAAPSGHETCETSARALCCLSELRELVTRLQAKELFPYNPSSLLKLLAQV